MVKFVPIFKKYFKSLTKEFILFYLKKITMKYQKCDKGLYTNQTKLCPCALTLRATDATYSRYMFVDYCSSNVDLNKSFKYFDESIKYENALNNGNFPDIDCESTILNENDLGYGEVNKSFNYFKCARIMSKTKCPSYLVIFK